LAGDDSVVAQGFSPGPLATIRKEKTMHRLLMALILAALAGATAATQPSAPAALALVGVHVIPMDRERGLENQTIVVRDGRIAGVGDAKQVTVPDGATRIDAAGKFVIPGLAEMHGHLTGANETLNARILQLNAAFGITTIRGMLGDPSHLSLRDRVARGELVGPRIWTSGPSLNGKSIPTPEAAEKAVREQKAAGFDFLKIHPGVSRAAFDALAKTAKEVDIRFAGHVPVDVGLQHALDNRCATIDHLDGFVEALVKEGAPVDVRKGGFFGSALIDHVDESKIPALVKATKAAGTAIVPTEALMDSFFSPEPVEQLIAKPEMKWLPADLVAGWEKSKRGFMTDGPGAMPAEKRERFLALRRKILKALHEGGVPLLLGADSPQVLNVPGVAIHRELALIVKAGLSPYQALETGTRNVAAYFGIAKEAGTIERGKRADLVVLDANPLDDIANSEKRFGVMTNGRWLPRAQIDKELAAAASAR
jgi:imidazolonepropionase-like amidohydrolase